MKTIDINCDLGEGLGNDSKIMPYVSSCNIACGGHAGSDEIMRLTVDLAQEHQVKIGAHPSFPDKKNFGRKAMNLSTIDLFESVKGQIESLISILNEKKLRLNHVKPHGALYNLAAQDEIIAKTIVDVVKSFNLNLVLYVPYQSHIEIKAIEAGVPIKYEAFADRNYNADLTLVSREKDYALIEDLNDMFNHVYNMIVHERVITIDGKHKPIKADTICIHGDTKNIVNHIKILKQKLKVHHIQIE